ncbi:RimK/LysX family protein [Thioalkalicoccus limnaeus]|uniref:RimK/LysX family protein n=1 Tax=Thioalkalicoccus limnaeus TaxID=120681 RepID=A0ABV4BAX3_9GAMM
MPLSRFLKEQRHGSRATTFGLWLLPWAIALPLAGCGSLPSGDATIAGQRVIECPAVECPICPIESDCPPPKVIERVVTKTVEVPVKTPPETGGDLDLPIIGAVEWVEIDPPGLRLEARIDTGAETTSIHAEDVKLVEIDGRRFVRYTIIDPVSGERHENEARLRRRVLIKQQDGQHDRRYVVRMWVTLGETRLRVDVTLADRTGLIYPVLIGRNMLTDIAIVDVSRHYTLTN